MDVFRGGTKTEKDVPELQQKTEDFALRVEHERIRVDALQAKIRQVKARITTLHDERSKKGGQNAPRAAQHSIRKGIRLLEENLHRRLLKLGDVETAANRHKLVINQLRQEQVQLKEVYETLRDELAEMKINMDEALGKAALICEERDQAFTDLTRIHEIVESEARQHRSDMKQWNKIVREEKQRQEIMRVQQGKHRDDNASLRMLIELRNTKADEMEKMRRTAELTYEKQLEQEAEAESMVEEYYAAFGQLKEMTNIDDVNRLVEMFVAVEDENFATFNFIQHINRQIEREEEAYVKVCEEYGKYQDTMSNTDRSRSRVIRSLETKLAKTLRQHEDFQVNKADNAAQLQQLANVVDSIFHKAECDQMSGLRDTWSRPEEKKISASDTALTTGIAILHADTHPMVMPNMSLHSLMRHGIGNMTILHYLGIIEQRAAEIINAFLAFRGAQSTGQGLPAIPTTSATPVVPPPKPYAAAAAVSPVRILNMPSGEGDEESQDGGDETPIPRSRMREFAVMTYRREMEALASRRMHKKESTKSASRMPRIGRGRRSSAGGVDMGMVSKKRAAPRSSTAVGVSRSTPALGNGAWGKTK